MANDFRVRQRLTERGIAIPENTWFLGAYQQMIEIHEPMRFMFVIETTEAIMSKIINENESIGRLCRGEWVQLVIMDPDTGELSQFKAGKFVAYQADP